MKPSLTILVVASLAHGCSTGRNNGNPCQAQTTQACFGPGACNGVQQCLADGSGWGLCDCSGGSSNQNSAAGTSLLAGAEPYTGTYADPGPVTITANGTLVELMAIPDQAVLLLNSPVASTDEATSVIDTYGATILGQIPAIGMYLVETQPGQEDAVLQEAGKDPRILAIFPNLVLETQGAADAGFLAHDGTGRGLQGAGANNGSTASGSDQQAPVVAIFDDCSGKHGCWVTSVLSMNATTVTDCYDARLKDWKTGTGSYDAGAYADEDDGLQTFNTRTPLWNGLWGLVKIADTPSGQPTFINMSIGAAVLRETCVAAHLPYTLTSTSRFSGYKETRYALWKAVTDTLVVAFRAHKEAASRIILSLSAGNAGVPLGETIGSLYQSFKNSGDVGIEEKRVLENNVVIVVQATPDAAPDFPSRFDYVDSWNYGDADLSKVVLAANNSWAAYGTSFAAPYALAQVYQHWKASGNSETATEALAAVKTSAVSNSGHIVASTTGDNPPLPNPDSDEVTPTAADLSNCPINSHWSQDLPACLFGYYDEKGQTASGVGTFPWIQFVRWPDVQTSLGLTGTWIQVESNTCKFTDTLTVGGADTNQVTTGALRKDCEYPAPCPTDSVPSRTMCTSGSSVATSISGSASITIGSPFSANLVSRWPHLPCCVLSSDYPNVIPHP